MGSKSIPNKNIRLLGEKPLIAWSIKTSLECGLRTIVDTDSENYANIAKKYGAEVLMRPPRLGKDDTSMFELLEHEVKRIDPIPDIIVLMQPTTPFRSVNEVKSAIDIFESIRCDSLITVEKVLDKYHPCQIIVDFDGKLQMATGEKIKDRLIRRQLFPNAYLPTGSLYIFKTDNLKNGNIYGDHQSIFITEKTININSESDFKEAESFLKNL